jgi:hypothetical protein
MKIFFNTGERLKQLKIFVTVTTIPYELVFVLQTICSVFMNNILLSLFSVVVTLTKATLLSANLLSAFF